MFECNILELGVKSDPPGSKVQVKTQSEQLSIYNCYYCPPPLPPLSPLVGISRVLLADYQTITNNIPHQTMTNQETYVWEGDGQKYCKAPS